MDKAGLPPCCLTWGQTIMEVIKIMVTSFKSSHAHTATLSVPDTAAGHCRPTPLPETPGHSWASLDQSLVGSLLLSPGFWCTQGSVCALWESVFQSCISSGGSVVGLMVTSSKRAYAIPRSAAPRAPAPAAGHCWPIPSKETLRHSSGSVSVGVSGCWCTRGLFEPSEHLWWVRGLILKVISCFKSVNFLIPSMISGKFHEVIGHV